MYCDNCGKEISKTVRFCPHCGHQIGNSTIKPPPKDDQNQNGSTQVVEPINTISPSDETLLLEARNTAKRMVTQGIIWGLIGLGITGITYMSAEAGDTYYIFWGLIIYGEYKFIQGIYYYSNPKSLIDKALDNLKKEAEKVSDSTKINNNVKKQEKFKPTLIGWIVLIFIFGSIFLLPFLF